MFYRRQPQSKFCLTARIPDQAAHQSTKEQPNPRRASHRIPIRGFHKQQSTGVAINNNDISTNAKRANCKHCLRAQKSCICDLVRPLSNITEVLIIQHPLEKKNAKGTARLLSLCLEHCKIVIGESFETDVLAKLLDGNYDNLLLYPDDGTPAKAPIGTAGLPSKPKRLILLDGTWRKSRKLLHCNPLLSTLPRLTLDGDLESRYLIRKAHKDGQLSTLEACALALHKIDGIDATPLLESFTLFVQRQISQAQQGRAISGTITR